MIDFRQIIKKIYDATANAKRMLIVGTTGNKAEVNASGQLKVVLDGKVDTNNTSTTPLTASATYLGTGTETLDYAMIFVTVFSDVASATDGLCVQVSSDNVTWRDGDCFTIPAGTEKTFSFQPNKRYARVRYINGGSNQATFDLQTIFKKTNSKPSSHRIQDAIVDEDDATLQKSVLTAKKASGVFTNINASTSGNLQVTDAENGLAIAKGEVGGTSFIHKFGNAPDFDIADGLVTIWDGANDAINTPMQYVYSATNDIDSISSSDNGDTQDIEIIGLDINYNEVTQTVTLTGQTTATLSTPLLRVFRMINRGSTSTSGFVYCYINGATVVSGVPSTASDVRAVINNGNNQTSMAVYTIPAGKTGYMRDWYASTSGARKTSVHVIHLDARPFGEVFQLKHVTSLIAAGTSSKQHRYEEPEIFLEKTDIEMQGSTDEDVASVAAGFDIVLVDN
jgi:hypothetical protein